MQSSDKRISTQDECLVYYIELIGVSQTWEWCKNIHFHGSRLPIKKKVFEIKLKFSKRKGGTGERSRVKMDVIALLICIKVYCSQKHLSENNLHQFIWD